MVEVEVVKEVEVGGEAAAQQVALADEAIGQAMPQDDEEWLGMEEDDDGKEEAAAAAEEAAEEEAEEAEAAAEAAAEEAEAEEAEAEAAAPPESTRRSKTAQPSRQLAGPPPRLATRSWTGGVGLGLWLRLGRTVALT